MRTIVDVVSGAVSVDASWRPEPVLVEPRAPRTISRYQLRRWLREARGITWQQVQTLAETMDEPARSAVLEWIECGSEADRVDPLVRRLALALPLHLTEATVDAALEQIWAEAAGLALPPAENRK